MNNTEYHLTVEGLNNLKEELDDLKNVKRPEVIAQLQEARGQGDLSENAEYDAAREAQAKLEDRIKELEFIIKNTVVIEHDGQDGTVNVGKKVTIEYLDGPNEGKSVTFNLVGTLEADPMSADMKISTESPIGYAINGKQKGDKLLVIINGHEFHIHIIDVK